LAAYAAAVRSRRWRVAAITAAVLVLVSCTTPPPTAETVSTAPVRGGRIVHGSPTDIKDLQPVHTVDLASESLVSLLYDTPTRFDAQTGEMLPNLATWTTSADGLTFKWSIRPEATWTDGRPVVADDWLTGLKAVARSKATIRKPNFSEIVGFTDYVEGRSAEIRGVSLDTQDPKRWTVTLGRVFCPAVVRTSGYILPAHVFAKYLGTPGDIDLAPENTAPMVTSGPFRFREWRRGDEVRLARNDGYWNGAPYVDEYIYKVVADTGLLAQQLKTGELNFGMVEPEVLADLRAQPHLTVHASSSLRYHYVGWNIRSRTAPALADPKVRRALAYAVDVDTFVRTSLHGTAERVYAHHPPTSWAAPSGPLERYAYDPSKAEQLLREAGYAKGVDGVLAKDGRRIELTIVATPVFKLHQAFAQVMVEQLRRIGVSASLRVDAREALVEKLQLGTADLDGWLLQYQLLPDPDPAVAWGQVQIPDAALGRSGFNLSKFTTPELERAITQGRTPSDGDCSSGARKRQYETVNAILNRELPYLFLWSPSTLYVSTASLRAFALGPNSLNYLWGIERWWLAR